MLEHEKQRNAQDSTLKEVNMKLIIKGYIMGIANLIPGLSGGTIALSLGIYDKFINALAHIKRDFRENIAFLLPLLLGLLLSFLTMSNIISNLLTNYALPTAMFFTGLVAGGIPMIIKDYKEVKSPKFTIKHLAIFKLSFILVLVMSLLDIFGFSSSSTLNSINFGTYIMILFAGIIVAGTMILPGISGSLLLMLLGLYDTIIGSLSSIGRPDGTTSDMLIIFAYAIGLVIGLVAMSRFIEYLFKSHREKALIGILGFMFSSVICLPFLVTAGTETNISMITIFLSAIPLVAGYALSYKLG